MSNPASHSPEPRDIRPAAGDARILAVTSGGPDGTSGQTPTVWRAMPFIAALIISVCTVNVFTHLDDAARHGHAMAAWEPITWEATSALTNIIACAAIWLALRLAPPTGRWLRFALIHAVGSVAFSAIHVGGMWALRAAIYALAGSRYAPVAAELIYEYRKDLLAYVGIAVLMWIVPRLKLGGASLTPPVRAGREDWFDIQDGARILRMPLRDILAVRAAGNYVEFLLRDARRPLMRARLSEIESALAPSGFLRTHRSWIVNPAGVRLLEPSGSGDYRLALEGGAEAPVSRRFPKALEKLKGGG
jgi:DNA-binding LytR/AlgR family response regulator